MSVSRLSAGTGESFSEIACFGKGFSPRTVAMQSAEGFKIKELSALPESAWDLLFHCVGAVVPTGEFVTGSCSLCS